MAHGLGGGVAIWCTVCALYGWERILRTDDPRRGGKVGRFVLHMTTKTKLVLGSIELVLGSIEWGVRVLDARARWSVDPLMGGVLFWTSLSSYQGAHMASLDALSHTASLDALSHTLP